MTEVLDANVSPSQGPTNRSLGTLITVSTLSAIEPTRVISSFIAFNRKGLLPQQIEFAAPPSARFRFRKPIKLELYAELDSVVAYSSDLEEFGTGDNIAEALDDFGKTIAEAYESLRDQLDALGEDLRQEFVKLQGYIEPTQHNQ